MIKKESMTLRRDEERNLMDAIKHRIADWFCIRPDTRDDDRLLISLIWQEELEKAPSKDRGALEAFRKGELTCPETIRRRRQLLQEKFPMYRGVTWESRQRKGKSFWKLPKGWGIFS